MTAHMWMIVIRAALNTIPQESWAMLAFVSATGIMGLLMLVETTATKKT